MDLHLHLDRLSPPSGWVERLQATDASRQGFEGWLELLSSLSTAFGEQPPASASAKGPSIIDE